MLEKEHVDAIVHIRLEACHPWMWPRTVEDFFTNVYPEKYGALKPETLEALYQDYPRHFTMKDILSMGAFGMNARTFDLYRNDM